MSWLSRLFAWFRREKESKPSQEMETQSHLEKTEQRVREKEQVVKELQNAIDQARTWRNRALMARQQHNEDLVKQAIAKMWQYQVVAAKLQGKEPPPEPNDIPPGERDDPGLDEQSGLDRPWRPYDPSRVPKRPLPSSGGGEVALPLPEKEGEG